MSSQPDEQQIREAFERYKNPAGTTVAAWPTEFDTFRAGWAAALAAPSPAPTQPELTEATMREMMTEARQRVRPTIESLGTIVGAPGNWVAPFHTCKCGESLNWREQGLHIVGECSRERCDGYFAYKLGTENVLAPSPASQQDTQRLDWLSQRADSESGIWGIERQALEDGRTLRAAIDAAMGATSQEEAP